MIPPITGFDRLRLEIGDTPAGHGLGGPRPVPDAEFEAVALFNDDELQQFLDERGGDLIRAAADALDTLASRYAGHFDISEDGQSMQLSQSATAFADRAHRYRLRALRTDKALYEDPTIEVLP